jgi:SAM-dependent methyltransferase
MSESQPYNDPVGEATLVVISKADKFNRWMYETIRPFLNGKTLEIGSGIGNISKYALAEQLPLTLSDINPVYKQILQTKFASYASLQGILSIDLIHPDFENVYIDLKEKFDSIFLLNVIEHVAEDDKAIKNCRYLLKPPGNLIVLAPAYQWLFCRLDKELGHYRRYTVRRMTALLRSQEFEIKHKQYFNFAGIPGWLVFGKIFRKKMLGNGEMGAFNNIVPLVRFIDKLLFKKTGLSIIVTGIKK